MKKNTLLSLVYALALVLVMNNCKDHDNKPFPTEPNSELLKEINAIVVTPVTPTSPAPVTTTPGTATVPAKTTTVYGDMPGLSTGTIPATVQTAANEVNVVLSAAEVNTLSSVTPAMIAAVAGGGALPADLKAIMDKVAANPALMAYLPTLTLPTVNGKSVSGRSGVPESVEKTEGILVEDACILAAQAAYDAVKTKLDATKAAEVAKITSTYTTALAPLAAEQASCTAGIPTKYTALRASVQAQANKAIADIEAAKNVIPAALVPVLKAFVNIQLLGILSSLNTLQAAELKACSETTTAKTTSFTAARDADLAKANANYAEALAKATAKKTELAQSCHNQGGGK